MKKYTIVMALVVGCLITSIGLYAANYYTCFAYFLPHRPALIELAPQDTLVGVHPEWIAVPEGFNATTINWTKGLEANTTIIRQK